MRPLRRSLIALVAPLLLASGPAAAKEPKPDKIPIAVGSWTGKYAGTFKSALRGSLGKDAKIVSAKTARVVVDGTVEEKGKGALVTVIVKLPKSGEVLERRDFTFSKPSASKGQASKMGKMVLEAAKRAPSEAGAPAP
jgi:hypothetical protein